MIKFDTAGWAAVMSKRVAAEISAKFADTGSRIGKDIEPQLRRIADRIVEHAAPAMAEEIKIQYAFALDAVSDELKHGIPAEDGAGRGWRPLTTAYAKYKARKYPGTENLFWYRSGELSAQFNKRAGGWKGAMTRIKTAVVLKNRMVHNKGHRYTYTLNVRTPAIGDPLYDIVFREAFVSPSSYNSLSQKAMAVYTEKDWTGSSALDRLAFNEFKASMYRPFIIRLMNDRGRKMQETLIGKLRAGLRTAR